MHFIYFLKLLAKNNVYYMYVRAFETPCTKRTESFALHMHNLVYGEQREGRHVGFYPALPFFRAVRRVLCPTRFALHPTTRSRSP